MKTVHSPLSSLSALITGCIIISATLYVQAQAGSLDFSFDPGDGPGGWVRAIQILEDEKILISGHFNDYDGVPVGRIARLHANGVLDTTFVIGEGANSVVRTLAIRPDGKILIGGDFTVYDNTSINRIARLNEDGSFDPTFDPGDGFDGQIFTMALQPDGKIVVGGNFTTYDNTPANHIIRLLPDGIRDPAFNPGKGADWTVRSLAIRPDGKINLAGHFYNYDGVDRIRVARIHPNGSLDLSFDPKEGPSNWVTSMALQPDGKIVIGGKFDSFNGAGCPYITRLNQDGSRDFSFDTGLGPNLDVDCLQMQSDGKFVIGGAFFNVDGNMYRGIARLNNNGSTDIAFDPGSGVSGYPIALAVQPDGKVLLGGVFNKYDGTAIRNIARIIGTDNSTSLTLVDNTQLNIFPNPTSGLISFLNYTPTKIEVYDQLGSCVYKALDPYREINISVLPDGLYYMKTFHNNQVAMQVVIKSDAAR